MKGDVSAYSISFGTIMFVGLFANVPLCLSELLRGNMQTTQITVSHLEAFLWQGRKAYQ